MTLAGAVRGVLRAPRRTFETLVGAPSWAAVLSMSLLISATSWGVLYSTERGRLALVDQWERQSYAVGRPVSDTEYTTLVAWSARGPVFALARAALVFGVLTVVVAVGLVGLVTWRSAQKPSFPSALALASHAGVVLALRDALSAPLAYVRETTASATTLGQWFPTLDEAAPLARLAGALDLFVAWWVVLVAVAAGVLSNQPTRRWVGPLAAAYLAVAVAIAAAVAIAERT